MITRLKNLLLSTFSLSMVLAVLIILFFNPFKKKYHLELLNTETKKLQDLYYFSDLNTDGESEKIILTTTLSGYGCVKIYDPAYVGQYNSQTFPDKNPSLHISNTDGDEYSELYFTGIRNDSVFLNQIDYRNPSKPREYLIEILNEGNDAQFTAFASSDLNMDGVKEIIVTISAGYSLQPRKIYAINLIDGNVLSTPLTGGKVAPYIIDDIDHDGLPEILAGSSATRNYRSSEIACSDWFSWFFIFDNSLNLKCAPFKINEKKSNTNVHLFQSEGENYILLTPRVEDAITNFLYYHILNDKGLLIRSDSIFVESQQGNRSARLTVLQAEDPKKTWLLSYDGKIFEIDRMLTPVRKSKLKKAGELSPLITADLNGDGEEEFLLERVGTNQFIVADRRLKHFTEITLPGIGSVYVHAADKLNNSGFPRQFYLQDRLQVFFLVYSQNPLWNFRFLIWLLIFGGLYALLWLLQYIQKERLEARMETRRKIKELQFKAITSQLNPHFTFNALNAFSSSVYDADKPEAYDRFVTFSRLIRIILSDSDRVFRTLEEEIHFTSDFLKIQQYRFDDAFDFEISVEDQVDIKMNVPKLIIQIFAENAVKHAFPATPGKDRLHVSVYREDYGIGIKIEDNGVGREGARERNRKNAYQSSGIGIKTLQGYIDLINSENKRKISFDIQDITVDDKPGGTRVMVHVPEKIQIESDRD